MKKLGLYILTLLMIACNGNSEKEGVKSIDAYFSIIKKNDEKLPKPKPGEWLYEFKENGQLFYDYVQQNPKKLNDSQNVIYLQPIGKFTKLQTEAMQHTREYLSIFFQTKVELLPIISDEIIPANKRRMRAWAQLNSLYFIDSVLPSRIPKDAIAYMAFTEKDLYPQDDWNFVFGQASYQKRVGVTSIFRLQGYDQDSIVAPKLFLNRLINVSSHEIGHMFTIAHCTFAKCVMNGSNNLEESDKSPNRLCSECQKKLYWNIKYDNKTRLNALMNFFLKSDLIKDYQLIKHDFESLKY